MGLTTSSELDVGQLPYQDRSARRRLGDIPPPPPPPPHVEHHEEPMPQFERAPRPPVLHREEHAATPDPIQAMLGDHPVEDPEALMPWYLKRRTLVALALLAVVLIALVVSLS